MTKMVLSYSFLKHQIIYYLPDIVVISSSGNLWIFLHLDIFANHLCYL